MRFVLHHPFACGLATVFGRMAEAVKMNMDDPERVAREIVDAVAKGREERYVGQPEGTFVRVNALLPRVVDGATRKQNRQTRPFAVEAADARDEARRACEPSPVPATPRAPVGASA